jgi:hypothetical protein
MCTDKSLLGDDERRSIDAWYNRDLLGSEPVLALAIEVLPVTLNAGLKRYNFRPGREFRLIEHQTAGHACHHHLLWITELAPRDEVRIALKDIAGHYLDSDMGCWGVRLDQILEYRARISAVLNADCNDSYLDLEEGIYPIDCTAENLNRLCSDELPKDLDELIEFKDEFDRVCGSVGRWKLLLLGENCD